MMQSDDPRAAARHLHPPADRPQTLARELLAHFKQLPYVVRVDLFGSIAGERWDRWSDIDMLVVTMLPDQGWLVYDSLQEFKPVQYDGGYSSDEPPLARAADVQFAGESLFNTLDLHLLGEADSANFETPPAWGTRKTIFQRDQPPPVQPQQVSFSPAEPLDRPTERLRRAVAFTRQALKRRLRGTGDQQALDLWSRRLQQELAGYQAGATTDTALVERAELLLELTEARRTEQRAATPPSVRQLIEPLLANEALRDNLDDQRAQRLLQWATGQIESVATQIEVPERLQAQSDRVQSALQQINKLAGELEQKQTPTAAELRRLLQQISEQTGIERAGNQLERLAEQLSKLQPDALLNELVTLVESATLTTKTQPESGEQTT